MVIEYKIPCWPVLIPQITGLLSPDVPVTTKESTQLWPSVGSLVAAGPWMVKVSKSNRTKQTSGKKVIYIFLNVMVIWRLLTIATFSDGISQRCCVTIRRGIRRVLNIRAILTDIAGGRKYEDTTDTKSSCAISQSSAAFVWTFRWSEACTIPATVWRRATIVFESHHIEEWKNWNENN